MRGPSLHCGGAPKQQGCLECHSRSSGRDLVIDDQRSSTRHQAQVSLGAVLSLCCQPKKLFGVTNIDGSHVKMSAGNKRFQHRVSAGGVKETPFSDQPVAGIGCEGLG